MNEATTTTTNRLQETSSDIWREAQTIRRTKFTAWTFDEG